MSFRLTPTDEELNRHLEEKLNIFRNAGLSLQNLTINDFVQIFFTFKDTMKILRLLESFITQGIILPLISEAQHHAILLPKASLEASDLCAVADWMKTPQGLLVIRRLQTERKLLKKAPVQCSAGDIAYTRLLNQQQADLSYELKEIRTRGELQIAELNKQIKQVKKKGEKEEIKIKDEYNAASNFADTSNKRLQEQADLSHELKKIRTRCELKIAELDAQIKQVKERGEEDEAKIKDEYNAAANFPDTSNKRSQELCWAKYMDECTKKGGVSAGRTDVMLKMVTEQYRREIDQTVVVEYCNDVKVRGQLIAYGKRKIELMKTGGKRKREMERFCNVLAVAAEAIADEEDSLDPI